MQGAWHGMPSRCPKGLCTGRKTPLHSPCLILILCIHIVFCWKPLCRAALKHQCRNSASAHGCNLTRWPASDAKSPRSPSCTPWPVSAWPARECKAGVRDVVPRQQLPRGRSGFLRAAFLPKVSSCTHKISPPTASNYACSAVPASPSKLCSAWPDRAVQAHETHAAAQAGAAADAGRWGPARLSFRCLYPLLPCRGKQLFLDLPARGAGGGGRRCTQRRGLLGLGRGPLLWP